MNHLTVVLLLMGASAPAWAANICNETVPSNRIIDGVPAYQQCTDSTNAAIYSNNGVDTATSSAGTDWVRTQYSGGYQCTELAHRYLYFKWGVKSVPNGNAGVWCDGTVPSGLVKTTTPVHGDLIVFAPGSCGADQTTGHVAVVDVVNTNATVTFIEQNRAGRRSCANDTAACFLHAIANDGTAIDGGASDGPAPDASAGAADASARPDRPADNPRADLSGSGGVAGTGGAVGSGGAIGSGGTGNAATGGASGSGGESRQGGATAGPAGTGGTTRSTAEPSAEGTNGCACRVPSSDDGSGRALVLMLIAAAVLVRRRQR